MPISPKDVLEKQESTALKAAEAIPDFVYEIFDTLIAKNYNQFYKQATIYQTEVVSLIEEQNTLDFAWRWLDVEPKYRSLGWKVEYNKQAYYEQGRSYFVFSIGEKE